MLISIELNNIRRSYTLRNLLTPFMTSGPEVVPIEVRAEAVNIEEQICVAYIQKVSSFSSK